MDFSKISNEALLRELKTSLQGFKEASEEMNVRMEDEYNDQIDFILGEIENRGLTSEAEEIASELGMTITEVQIQK